MSRALNYHVAFPPNPGHCRVCAAAISPKRSTCGGKCAEFVNFCIRPNSQRWRVFKRDRGVCEQCGFDAQRAEQVVRWARRFGIDGAAMRELRTVVLGTTDPSRDAWDMDHRVPVVFGGGVDRNATIESMMANLRTLCIPCHKKETAKLAKRRAVDRFNRTVLPHVIECMRQYDERVRQQEAAQTKLEMA